ncbi:MAG: MFS transporter [Anaerolineaceae bacterium]|nr:MFS transporter [Anaerolineaceae bacterium]
MEKESPLQEDKSEAGKKRYLMLFAGVIILLIAGVVYAWGTLSVPIAAEFQWGKAEISLVFTVMMIAFCLGGFISGKALKRLKPGLILIASALFFLSGFHLAAMAEGLPGMILTFALLCGLAAGFAYNSVLSSVTRLFPGKQGLASGLLLMGFGAGSFVIGKLFQIYTPLAMEGWRQSFRFAAMASALILFGLSFLFYDPIKAQSAANLTGQDLPLKEVIKRAEFWMFFFWAVLMGATGLVVIAQVAGVARVIDPQIPFAVIATLGGLIALFNGIGRVAAGQLFDLKGRFFTICMVNLAFMASLGLLVLSILTRQLMLMFFAMAGFGFSYGGIPSTCSAFVACRFGKTYFPENLSAVTLNLIPASLLSSASGLLYDRFGTYWPSFILMGFFILFGLILNRVLKKRIEG